MNTDRALKMNFQTTIPDNVADNDLIKLRAHNARKRYFEEYECF